MVKALEDMRRLLVKDSPDTLIAMNNLAGVYKQQSEFAKAEPLFVQALAVGRRVLGEEHPLTLASLNNLATGLTRRPGGSTSAFSLYEEIATTA